MAISLIFSPDALALTRGGRLYYQFHGDGRMLAAGTAATNGIVISGALVAGNAITIEWGDHRETLTIRDNPAEPGELPAGNGGADYVDNLAEYLSEYQPIREYFIVSRDGLTGFETIVLTARNTGSAYTVRQISTTGNWMASNALPGQDTLIRERYSIYVELHVARPGLSGADPAHFDKIYASFLETDEAGYAPFDCGAMLHNQLTADLPYFQSGIVHVDTLSARPYYVSYGEAWGSPIKAGRVTDGPTKRAYLGGADYLHAAGNGFSLTQLGGIQPSVARALRFGPRRRYVRLNEPQYLTFVNFHGNVASIGLKVQLVLDDDEVIEKTDLVDEVAFPTGAKVTFSVGFTALGLDSYIPSGHYLKQYIVRLHHSGTDYSVDYTYTIDYAYRPYTRYFVFLNSLGAFDSLTTYGKGNSELQRISELVERSLAPAYEVEGGQFIEYDVTLQQQYEVATGFRTEAHLLRWQDFYRSGSKFLLKPSQQVLPIGILSKSIKQGQDGDSLFAHTFSFSFLFQDMFFTSDDEFDETPPPGFLGVGSITIEQTTVVASVDNTVPDAARQITTNDLNLIRQIGALSASVSSKLSPSAADQLYPRKNVALTLAQANDEYLPKSAISPTAPLEVGGIVAPLATVTEGEGLVAVSTPDPSAPAKKEFKLLSYANLKTVLTNLLGLDGYVSSTEGSNYLSTQFNKLIAGLTLEKVIGVGSVTRLPATFEKGMTVVGKGVDQTSKKKIRFFQDLEEAPEDGSYQLEVIEEKTKESFRIPFSRGKAIMDGVQIQTPASDPGPPVAPVYAERVFSSGVDINFSFAPFQNSLGQEYPVPMAYRLDTTTSSFSLAEGTRNVSGKISTGADLVISLGIIGRVLVGTRQGVEVTAIQKIRILAATVPQLPQPSLAPLSAASGTQNESLDIQPVVTYANGITKAGTYAASGLPTGVSINQYTGKITGAPVSAGTSQVSVTFTDVDGQSDTINFVLTIAAAPITVQLLAAAYETDSQTHGSTFRFACSSAVTSVKMAIESLDSIIRTGMANGVAVTTDTGAGNWKQTCVPGSYVGGQFNFSGFFNPNSISPMVGGLTPGKRYKVHIWLNTSTTAIVRYFYFNPSTNVQTTPLLATEPTEGGTGNTAPIPPVVSPKTVTVGVPFEHYYDLFTDPDGEAVTYPSITGYPPNTSAFYSDTLQKLVVKGTVLTPGSFVVTFIGQDSVGGQAPLNISYTSVQQTAAITGIYRAISAQQVVLSWLYYPTYGVTVSGNSPVETRTKTGSGSYGSWETLTLASGRYSKALPSQTSGTLVTTQFRIVGQTEAITLEFTVTASLAEALVWPEPTLQGNNLTPNRLLRVGQPSTTALVYNPTTSWVAGPDGTQWLQVACTLPTPTYAWKVFVNGEPVTGFPIKLPQHTQATIDIMDCYQYAPNVPGNPIASKAQLILYTGTPSGSNVTQNT